MSESSCHNTVVNVVNPNHSGLNLTCFDVESCAEMNVFAEEDSDVMINCMRYGACHDLNITANHADNITILCDADRYLSHSACNNFKVYALNVTNEVKIVCSGDHSCYYIDVYANYARNVIVDASGDHATYYGSVSAQNADNMLISCKARDGDYSNYGCYGTKFYISTDTSMECEGFGCYSLSLYSVNGYSSITDLSINGCNQCDSVDNCIYDWHMNCGETYSEYDHFYGGTYCYYDNCGCDNTHFLNLVNHGWSDTSQCQITTPDISCKGYGDCVIECDAPNSCQEHILSAGNATSMTVLCTGSSSCENARIYCPKSENSQCNVLCDGGYESCEEIVIYAADYADVNLTCADSWSCEYAAIFVGNSSNVNVACASGYACYRMDIEATDANNVVMDCTYDGSCSYNTLHAENATNISILCHNDGACYGLNLYADNTDMLSVECIGEESCESIDIYGNNAENMFVYGIGSNSMRYGQIYAKYVNNANLHCASQKGDISGCGALSVYVPIYETMNIECTGFGCDNLQFYSQNGMSDLQNISLNGEGQNIVKNYL